MSKGMLLLFISFTFVTQTNNKRKALIINIVPFETLNGNVKQIIKIAHRQFDGGTSKSHNIITDTTYFDKNGNPTEIHWNQIRGYDRVIKYVTRLGKKGERVETRLLSKDGQTIFQYNANGNIVESWFEDKNSVEKYKASYIYDADGKMIEQDYFLSPKLGQQKGFFKYDTKNRLIESDLFSKDNELKDKSLIKYVSFDKNGNWAEMIKTSTDGYLLSTDTITRTITYY